MIGQSPFSSTAVIANNLSTTDISTLQAIENQGKALTIGILNAQAEEPRLQAYRDAFKSEVVAVHPDHMKKLDLDITEPVFASLGSGLRVCTPKANTQA